MVGGLSLSFPWMAFICGVVGFLLLCLYEGQSMAEPLALDDCGMADSLVLAEDTIGKRVAFPANFQRPVGEIVKLDILACQLLR